MALYEDLSTGRCRSDKFEVNSKFVWTDADYTIGTEAANKINVAVRLKDGIDKNLLTQVLVDVYFSDSSDGSDIITTAPDGAVAIGTNGTVVESVTAKKHLKILTNSTGQFDLDITETGAKTLYIVCVNPMTGGIEVSDAVTFST